MTVKTGLLILAYSLGLALLLTLGSWQIARGLDKATVLAATETGSQQLQQITALPKNPERFNYQSALLEGSWDQKRIILLANRIYQSQLGYEVIVPFRLRDDTLILVNRGWIKQGKENEIPAIQTTQAATGTLYMAKKGFTLGQAIQTEVIASPRWPKISLYMDSEQFEKALKQPVSPLVLVLDGDNANSLIRLWKPVVIQPERHYAYALQWFGLAGAFVVFGIIWFRRLKRNP